MSAQNRRHATPPALEAGYAMSQEMVEEYPITSTVVAFGVGMAAGLLVGHLLAEPVSRLWEPEPSTMEKFGRHVYDAIKGSLPESLGRHLQH